MYTCTGIRHPGNTYVYFSKFEIVPIATLQRSSVVDDLCSGEGLNSFSNLNTETVNSCTVPSTEFFSPTQHCICIGFITHYGKRKHCETAHQCRMSCLSVCGSTRSPSLPATSRELCREQYKSFLGWLCSPNTSGAELMEL